MIFNNNLFNAINDYYFLINKDYPVKATCKLISDRYRLSGEQRSILFRGIYSRESSLYRISKKVSMSKCKNQIIHIDGYNVIYTIISYLKGIVIYIGTDSFLRDTAENHGKKFDNRKITETAGELIDFLYLYDFDEINFYFDSPVSKSGELTSHINNLFIKKEIKGCAFCEKSPDHILKKVSSGLVATSDSNIIDNSFQKVTDLAYSYLRYKYKISPEDLRAALKVCFGFYPK